MKVTYITGYPRKATVGNEYLLTFDVEFPAEEWPFEGMEEYPLDIYVPPGPGFTCTPLSIASTRLVMRRAGGTSGPAKFLLTAVRERAQDKNRLRIAVVNKAGSTIGVLHFDDLEVSSSTSLILPLPDCRRA